MKGVSMFISFADSYIERSHFLNSTGKLYTGIISQTTGRFETILELFNLICYFSADVASRFVIICYHLP